MLLLNFDIFVWKYFFAKPNVNLKRVKVVRIGIALLVLILARTSFRAFAHNKSIRAPILVQNLVLRENKYGTQRTGPIFLL